MNTKEIKSDARKTGCRKGQKNRGMIWGIALVVMLLLAPQVMAISSYQSTFGSTYPTAAGSKIVACNLCHNSPGGGGALNSYGSSYASSGGSFASIETTDSDGDGWTNLQEINT